MKAFNCLVTFILFLFLFLPNSGNSQCNLTVDANSGILDCVSTCTYLDAWSNSQDVTYSWISYNGSIISNDQNAIVCDAGTYQIVVTELQTGCTATASVDVLSDQVTPTVDIISDPTDCTTGTTVLHAISSGSQSSIVYQWYSANGSVISGGSSAQTIVNAPGLYCVDVINIFNGCYNQSCIYVDGGVISEIQSLSNAFCTASSLQNTSCEKVCGNSTAIYTISNLASGNDITWEVVGADDFYIEGDYLTVNWGNTGSGLITAQGNSGSGFSVGFSEITYPSSNGNLGVLQPITTCGGGALAYQWSNGSSNSIQQVQAPGTYTVTVTNSNGNTATASATILETEAQVGFQINHPLDCSENNGSISSSIEGEWSTGEFGTSISDLSPGTYSFSFIDANGQVQQTSFELKCCQLGSGCFVDAGLCVEILEEPTSKFSTQPVAVDDKITICEGQSVFFTNESIGAISYYWDFGNGNYSSDLSVEETYLTAGTYEAMLIARNDCYCSDTMFTTIIVEDAISPEIKCLGTICEGENITYSTDSDCSIFNWVITPNGTVTDGGGINDNFITVDWNTGPIGTISLSVDGCNGGFCSTPTIEEIPIIADNTPISGPTRICQNEVAEYSVAEFGSTDFTWTVSPGGEIESGQGTNRITINWNGAPSLTAQRWVQVNYDNCYLGCSGSSILNVKILPEFYIESDVEVCAYGNSEVQAINTLTGVSFPADWKIFAPDGSVVLTTTGVNNISVDWMNGPGRYTVVAVPSNPEEFCTDSYSAYVTALAPPSPAFGITGDTDICPDNYYPYEVNASVPDATFKWNINNGGVITQKEGKIINVLWGASPPYILEVQQISTTGLACESDFINLEVQPIETLTLSGSGDVCREETASYIAPDFDNADYQWSVTPADAGSIISGQGESAIEILWHTPGNSNVEVQVCGVSSIYNVTVMDLPQPVVTYPEGLCPGTTGPVSTTSTFLDYKWMNDEGQMISTSAFPNLFPGFYELEVTDDFGCTNNTTFFIESYPEPEIHISVPGSRVICYAEGSPPVLIEATNTDAGYDYQWYYNNVPIGGNTTSITTTSYGFFRVEVTDENGCFAISNTIELQEYCLGNGTPGVCNNPGLYEFCDPGTTVSFTFSPTTFCNTFDFTNTSSNFITGTVNWDFDDPNSGVNNTATGNNVSHTFTNAGHYIVTQTALSDLNNTPTLCWDAQIVSLPLSADFKAQEGCAGNAIAFEDLSTFIPDAEIATWEWDFGDPTSGSFNESGEQHPTHIYAVAGEYNVNLLIVDQNGCTSEINKSIIVRDLPMVNFGQPLQNCQGSSLNFIAQVSSEVTSVSWNFGDTNSGDANTSESFNTHHVYDSPGDYLVVITAENVYGCSQTYLDSVTVEPNGLGGVIAAVPSTEVCEGNMVTLHPPSGGQTWEWSNGAITETVSVIETDVLEVTITDANGCKYITPPIAIDVLPLPQATIKAVEYNEFDQAVAVYYNTFSSCQGTDVHLEIEGNPDYGYVWSNGISGLQNSFTEEKENLLLAGTHEFYVSITNHTTGCAEVEGPFVVVIHPVPNDMIISSDPPLPFCENTPVTLTINNPDPNFTYVWNDGQLGTSINITGVAGDYFVRAISPFGCEGESDPITILPAPDFRKVPSGCHTRCEPDTICLPALPGVVNYQWYLNGSPLPGPQGNVPDLIALESGEYHLEMTDVSGCITNSDPLNLDLFTGFGVIGGTVYFDANNNGIIDADDTPYEGAVIELMQGGTTVGNAGSGNDGNYYFPNILSTSYSLTLDETQLPLGYNAVLTQADVELIGCDDHKSMNWLVYFECITSNATISPKLCSEETMEINGTIYSQSNPSGEETLMNFIGCDSIVTVNLSYYSIAESFIYETLCFGETIEVNGTIYDAQNPSGSELYVLGSSSQCDSIVYIDLSFEDDIVSDFEVTLCAGESVSINGTTYDELNPNGQEVFDGLSTTGCDSTVNIALSYYPIAEGFLQQHLCFDESIIVNGVEYDASNPIGEEILSGQSSTGCDSIVTINLSFENEISFDLNTTLCLGESIIVNGQMYNELNPNGQEVFSGLSVSGCDSTVNVALDFYTESIGQLIQTLCLGESIEVNGNIYDHNNSSGIETLIGASANQCDSIVEINLSFDSAASFELSSILCPGESVIVNGTTYDQNTPVGQETFFDVTPSGCDSIVNINLDFYQEAEEILNTTLCFGESVEINGTIYNANNPTGIEILPSANMHGCDSTIIVDLSFDSEISFDLLPTICQDETITVNGTTYDINNPTGIEVFIGGSVSGCDSMINIALNFYPSDEFFYSPTLCSGENIMVNGTTYDINNPSGTEILPSASTNGCDSFIFVNITVLPPNENILELIACNGEDLIFDGVPLPPGSSTPFLYTDQNGCDSTVQVEVIEQSLDFTPLTVNVCFGELYEYEGNQYPSGSQEEFTYLNQFGCDSTILLIVEAYPEMVYELSSVSSCPDISSGEIDVTITSGTPPIEYSIDGVNFQQDPSFSFSGLGASEYHFTIQDGNGCWEEEFIDLPQIPNITFTIDPTPLPCNGDVIYLTPEFQSGDIDDISYLWSTGDTSFYINTNEVGEYSLQVSNECEIVEQIINVQYDREGRENYLYVPNAFSPNGDGYNDLFKAAPAGDIEISNYTLYVFNRWGDELFNTQSLDEGWDGKFKNKMMQSGVYVWYIRAEVTYCGHTFDLFKKGDVTIVN